jgi:hypothetical protein
MKRDIAVDINLFIDRLAIGGLEFRESDAAKFQSALTHELSAMLTGGARMKMQEEFSSDSSIAIDVRRRRGIDVVQEVAAGLVRSLTAGVSIPAASNSLEQVK